MYCKSVCERERESESVQMNADMYAYADICVYDDNGCNGSISTVQVFLNTLQTQGQQNIKQK